VCTEGSHAKSEHDIWSEERRTFKDCWENHIGFIYVELPCKAGPMIANLANVTTNGNITKRLNLETGRFAAQWGAVV